MHLIEHATDSQIRLLFSFSELESDMNVWGKKNKLTMEVE